MITLAPVVCSVSLVVKILFSFRQLSKSSVDVTGTPLTSGRPLPRESDGSVALQILVPAAVERHAFATHQHIHTYTHNHSRAHEHTRAHTQIASERETHTHTCQPPGRSPDRGVDSKGLAETVAPERASPPDKACRLHWSKSNLAPHFAPSQHDLVAGRYRGTPGSQQRLQDIIYRHSGCREQAHPWFPAAVARHHLPPLGLQGASGHLPAPHATRIWNSS